MKIKLTKYNNDWLLILPQEIIDNLEINPQKDIVNLNIENKTIKIKKTKQR